MKNRIKCLLQFSCGYERYLRCFAWFKVRTLHLDRREEDFLHFLRLIPEDGVVLDIGANLGFLCVHLARRVSRGRVIAFEPLPDNHRVLCWLLRHFRIGNVEVHRWALGDRDGEVEMVLPIQGRARQQGLGHVVGEGGQPEHGITFHVPLRRLDGVEAVNSPTARVAAIKMDVENFEQFVLRGAMHMLERDRPLVYLELWDNQNRQTCFAMAGRLGYRVMVFESGRLVAFDPAAHRHGNFFFVPPAERGLVPAAAEEVSRVTARGTSVAP